MNLENAGLKCTARGSLEMQDPKNRLKNRHLGTIAQICRAISSQLRHISTVGEKNLLSSNISSTSPQYGEHSILAAEIFSLVWGTPANFSGFRVLALLLQQHHSTEANQTLHSVWPLPWLVVYVYIFGSCCSVTEFCQNGILPVAKFTLCPPSIALCYWQCYCMAVEQWAQVKLYSVEHRALPIFSRATIRLDIGPHSS